jgi:hypothetical protein
MIISLPNLVDDTFGGQHQADAVANRSYAAHCVHSSRPGVPRMVIAIAHADVSRGAIVLDVVKWLDSYEQLAELVQTYPCDLDRARGSTEDDIDAHGLATAMAEVEAELRGLPIEDRQ